MIEYKCLTADEARQRFSELGDVLQACVKDGASVGFIDPTDRSAIDPFTNWLRINGSYWGCQQRQVK